MTTSTLSGASQTPAPRAGLILALVALPVFIGALDLTVVSAVLPQVVYDLAIPLQTGLDDAAWVVSGYLLAYTIAMTFMGRVSDLLGRRWVYLISLLVFALGSWLVAIAEGTPARWVAIVYRQLLGTRPDPSQAALWAIILGRAVQAFGAGALVPVSMALAGDLYPPAQRAGPLGFIAAADTAGWVVGHLYGGIIARFFDWRFIFWLNLPICAVAFALIWWVLRGVPRGRGSGAFDGVGALLLAGALVGLNLALGGSGEMGGSTTFGTQAAPQINWLGVGLSLGLLVAFVVWSWWQAHPLLPLRLFRQRNFAAACAANFGVGFSLVIAIANVPLFINSLIASDLQQGAWDSGWLLSGLTVPMAATAWVGGWLTARWGYRWPALLGLLGTVVGFGLMSTWHITTPYAVMLVHLAVAGIGFGLVIAPIATAVINAANDAERGVASALVIILRLCGMTLGLSAMTTYGLQRAEGLLQLAGTPTDFNELVNLGMQIANQVINETFLIAAGISALALVPVWWLAADPQPAAQTIK